MPQFSFSNVTPNWFASVMGTGIVASAAAVLPLQFPGLRVAALVVWLIAAALLVFFVVAEVAHWAKHGAVARRHHLDPVMAHFYGAPPMAFLTVGAGAVLVGRDLIGLPAAVAVDAVLWTLGTVGGLISAVIVPYLAFTRHENSADAAFGGWLMPVVPPMVSAATGALLLPFLPAGQARETLLFACYSMFGLSLLASLVIIVQLWQRLAVYKVGSRAMVPTLWIVLGPLGQSITAVTLLAGHTSGAVGGSLARALTAFAILYGAAVLGFALLWLAISAIITVRTAREGLPFSLTWWSFTFPVGTVVTGTAGLAARTGLVAVGAISVALFVVLVVAWATVGIRTLVNNVVPAERLTTARAN
ncbi:TDT family transporter [uncultured Leifsonia sp.]|uniref:TDT family transporter n=1 Tax=uncultured Leifsonia sp. TaxID=340359 RepID=UPI0028D2D2DF|nr:TDT family transporter [uncultured Leifsonia sp.]